MFAKLVAVLLAAAVVWAVAARSSDGAGAPRTYVVRPHDTLWSIAARNLGGDTRDAIWRIQQLNHLEGATLRPGERLVLP
jgi:LysM repeat protein